MIGATKNFSRRVSEQVRHVSCDLSSINLKQTGRHPSKDRPEKNRVTTAKQNHHGTIVFPVLGRAMLILEHLRWFQSYGRTIEQYQFPSISINFPVPQLAFLKSNMFMCNDHQLQLQVKWWQHGQCPQLSAPKSFPSHRPRMDLKSIAQKLLSPSRSFRQEVARIENHVPDW